MIKVHPNFKKRIARFEIQCKDEFKVAIWKGKGKPKNILNELEDFFKEKGL